jgi:crotonobetainyl-CoA:carnitine CoA-transferase CaiB-like acyl-CoA transferase
MDASQWQAQTDRMAGIFASRTQQHWADHFHLSDACVAPVLSPGEAMAHPMNTVRQVWRDVDGALQAAPAPRFDNQTPAQPRKAPARDQDRAEILAELEQFSR